ncbi:MAG: hydantoinase/oxoprolinase family protein [Chloroflexi bacterium]|nr:hydantoinase/oxoprolinase family protein [Chloroflexota bacterium]
MYHRRMTLGVDIGGTFTDFVALRDGRLRVYKRPSTPSDPARALLDGLSEMGLPADIPVVHGSTVATNAVLEGKGARTALLVTAGFRDLLAIGRQDRPALYDWDALPPSPLVPSELSFEIHERVDARGRILQPLDPDEIDRLAQRLTDAGVESVAVCLLFSFLAPEHERRIARRLGDRWPLSLSSEVLPEFREFERASTTVLNAYVMPLMARYLNRLSGALAGDLRIMQSSGGSISAGLAARQPVRTILSGPAGGVAGAFALAQRAGFDHIITLDMGGTSADVSLCPGHLQYTTEYRIAGWPVGVPVIDIHTVGAGGGSIARVDVGGALRVGPESAGADPGPACYGRGQAPTVTDANLLLGRVQPDHFLGGRMRLDVDRARSAMGELAREMGVDVEQAALGVVRVADATMERAIRVISVERGFDPRRFTLVAFGGAGPLHAPALAAALGIPYVLIPRYPGLTSALGLLLADVVKDHSRTVMWEPGWVTDERLLAAYQELENEVWRAWRGEGLTSAGVQVERALDLRYVGQSYELTVPYVPGEEPWTAAVERFHAAHQARFQHAHPDRPVEAITLRVRLRLPASPPDLRWSGGTLTPQAIAVRPVRWEAGWADTPLYRREDLARGARLMGPALVVQLDSTVPIPPGWSARVDDWGNLILSESHGETSI